MDDQTIQLLERQIDTLIKRVEELVAENKALKQQEKQHIQEKNELSQRNASAADKITIMINRLKALENNA